MVKMKSKVWWFFLGIGLVFNSYAKATYIKHIIYNKTPFEFYYSINPATEVPTIFSCNCSGVIFPGEHHICDCYSDLTAEERRYRLEYMKNISPSYRLTATHSTSSDVAITWELMFDSYWDWIGVSAHDKPLG